MLVSLVTGTRPQIIKSAPVMNALSNAEIDFEFIHTGQHYDYDLAGAFIDEFELAPPVDLGIGPGDYCHQTHSIIKNLSEHLNKSKPDFLIVPGDTTSALGAAITGFKMEIPVCHLESGLRRYDLNFQEEMNRRLIDHGSSALFAPTDTAVKNLKSEAVLGKIFQIGDTMYDLLKNRLSNYSDPNFTRKILKELNVAFEEHAVLTVHRRESVESREVLSNIVSAINALSINIIIPLHPHTQKKIEEWNLKFDESHIKVVNPLPYDEFMSIVAASKLVISDSGGLQKECYLLNVPQVSMQTRTEWVETVEAGANVLSGFTVESIISCCEKMYGKKLSNNPSVYGDGTASQQIPRILKSGEVAIPKNRHKDK